MTVDKLQGVLLWSGLLNYGLLILWVLMTFVARDFYHRKARWFGVSPEQFDLVNFAGILFYKVSIFLLFLMPYAALRFFA